jgi:hypothetical protein
VRTEPSGPAVAAPPAVSQGRLATGAIGVSLALVIVTGLLGPSAAQPSLPGRFALPWQLGLEPSPWLVTALLLAAIGFGAAGLVIGLRAIAAGWRLDQRTAVVAGAVAAVAMVVIPPMGSADVLVYAAYGRIASLGDDPYTTTATDLAATGDPIGRSVERPWQDTPSIYGPVATGEQWLASHLGGTSMQATVWWLAAFTAIAFVVTGLLLLRLAGSTTSARSRVMLLWWLNPLLLYEVVNGAHLDGIGIAFAVAALALVRRSPLGAGFLVGLAVAVKLSFGLYVLALAWAVRRSARSLALLAAGALVVFVAAYATVGLHALDQARSASRLVSFAMPSRLLVGPLEALLPNHTARDVIATLSWIAFAALALWLMSRPPFGGPIDPSRSALDPVRLSDPTYEAIRTAAALTLAWSLTATYSLPWYDVAAWAPIALLAATPYDWLLIARTTVLSVAYIPGRVVDLPAGLDALTRNLRGTLGPLAGIVLIVFAVILVRVRPEPAQASRTVT